MITEKELRQSPYYYRLCKVDQNGFVELISVEDKSLEAEMDFVDFLHHEGYHIKEKKEGKTIFVAKEGG